MTAAAIRRWTLCAALLGGAGLARAATELGGPPPASGGLDLAAMLTGLFGGLALFLYGMEKMTESLQAAAGDAMKDFLARLTSNRCMGVLTGAFVTAVIQSSSVTTVLVVGFVSAGLMTLQQSIGVIMGANLGTTITAQIVAFKVTKAALPMIAGGYALVLGGRREGQRHAGGMLMGLGLLFFGMGIMSGAMAPLRTYQPFIEFMARLENPFLGITVAATFTALVQSSSATTGIVIVMATQGLCSLEAGIALALGANVGTCITAVLAAMGKPSEARRAAAVHVLFNVLGVLIWLPFIGELGELVTWLSPTHEALSGTARLAAEVPRQIANANTLFNLANTLLFLGFTASFARAAEWLVPAATAAAEAANESPTYCRFLDPDVLETPALALEQVRWQLGELGADVEGLLDQLAQASLHRDEAGLAEVAGGEKRVDRIRAKILAYLGAIREQALTHAQSQEVQDLTTATETLEYISDVVAKDMVKLSRRAFEEAGEATEGFQQILGGLFADVRHSLLLATRSVRDADDAAADEVIEMKPRISTRVQETMEFQVRTLDLEDSERRNLFRIEMETVDDLRRIYTLARRIARLQQPKVRKV